MITHQSFYKTIQHLKLPALCSLTLLSASCAHKIKPRIVIDDAKDLPSFSTSLGAVNKSSSLNISSLARRVAKNNPQLRTAKLRIAEAQGRIVQSGRLDNPSLGIGISKSIPSSEGGLEVSFSQRFPITNRLSLEKRVTTQELRIAQQEIKVAEQSLISAAQLVAVEILHIEKKQSNLNKQIESLSKINQFIDEAAKRGELSALDAAQTRLEIQSLKISKQQLSSEKKILTLNLKKYLGLSAGSPLNVSGNLPSTSIPSRSLALNNRADYRAKGLEINHSKSSILLEKSKRYDDVEMSFSGGLAREEDAPDGLETEGSIGMGLTIPLPFYNKNEGNIQSATAKTQRVLLEKKQLAAEIRLQVASQRQAMQNWLNQNAAINSDLLPLAEKTSDDLDTAYRNGQGDFTSLLKSKSQAIQLRSQLIDNELKFHQARVKYFAALGTPNSAF